LALSPAIAILAGTVAVSGCASVFEGTTQQISVSTNPTGAHCMFMRNGNTIATVPSTPGAATIEKTKEDLVIVCSKRGYSAATYVNRPGLAMVSYANLLTGGLTWAVDSTRGADNKYQGQVELALAPLGPGGPAEPRLPVPDQPPAVMAPPPPDGASRTRVSAPAPVPPPPVPAPAEPQINCAAADGSVIRVTGTACPSGWTLAR
jgi:hypothetical protein